jgi:hypothetical protein
MSRVFSQGHLFWCYNLFIVLIRTQLGIGENMPEYKVLSGTWYTIEAPNKDMAEKAWDAFWDSDEKVPFGCEVFCEEVGSHWEEEE